MEDGFFLFFFLVFFSSVLVKMTTNPTPKPLSLVFVVDEKNGKVLLGRKKRGFGQGKWNGFGGKMDAGLHLFFLNHNFSLTTFTHSPLFSLSPLLFLLSSFLSPFSFHFFFFSSKGETMEECAVRELREESGLDCPLSALLPRGILYFTMLSDGMVVKKKGEGKGEGEGEKTVCGLLLVHVYSCTLEDVGGELRETEEMKGEWWNVNEVPLKVCFFLSLSLSSPPFILSSLPFLFHDLMLFIWGSSFFFLPLFIFIQ